MKLFHLPIDPLAGPPRSGELNIEKTLFSLYAPINIMPHYLPSLPDYTGEMWGIWRWFDTKTCLTHGNVTAHKQA